MHGYQEKLCINSGPLSYKVQTTEGVITRRHRDHVTGTCVDNETAEEAEDLKVTDEDLSTCKRGRVVAPPRLGKFG